MAVRGRHQQDPRTKEWGIYYRPYRNYWILLLLTVNDRLFALQVPKVIPDKIKSQYEEQEELAMMQTSLKRGEITFKKPEGVDRRYQSIKDRKQLDFIRDLDKIEANINPEPNGSVVIAEKKANVIEKAPIYDDIINQKVQKQDGQLKFTFETQELYEQADHLCQQIPHWKTDNENPIY